ncbi:MAG TPA: hypothetical protein VIM84_04620, partial [Gemmatimonadales bacterium]
PVPPVTLARIRARAVRPVRPWVRIAAGIALVLAAAGVAYAAPGSPLPRILSRLVTMVSTRPETRAPGPRQSDATPSGISVPLRERLTVVVDAKSGDTAVVSLSPGTEVMLRVTGGEAAFSAEAERLLVTHEGGPARIELLVPKTARSVALTVAGRRLWLKTGARIQSPVEPDTAGNYVLPLTSARPTDRPTD